MFSTMCFLLASEMFSKQAAKRSPNLEEDMLIFSRIGEKGIFILVSTIHSDFHVYSPLKNHSSLETS